MLADFKTFHTISHTHMFYVPPSIEPAKIGVVPHTKKAMQNTIFNIVMIFLLTLLLQYTCLLLFYGSTRMLEPSASLLLPVEFETIFSAIGL